MADNRLPLVSVLIPAYNRPDLLRKAIRSVLAQTYKNIEIIICDDSTNNDVRTMILPIIQRFRQIKYFKNERNLFLENWHRCYQLANGEYINYLMDDDAFHMEKIEKMMSYYLKYEDVTLVTSFRQLIDGRDNPLPPVTPTSRLFNDVKILHGIELGDYVLSRSLNVIGEGTTVLFRKKDLTEKFGTYKGRQYCNINDVATWMSLLAKGKAVYIPEALSYFRIHPNQTQNSGSTTIISNALDEWLDIMVDSRKDGFLESQELFRAALCNWKKYVESYQLPKLPALHQKKQEVLERINAILATI